MWNSLEFFSEELQRQRKDFSRIYGFFFEHIVHVFIRLSCIMVWSAAVNLDKVTYLLFLIYYPNIFFGEDFFVDLFIFVLCVCTPHAYLVPAKIKRKFP